MNAINSDLEFFEENRECSYFKDKKSDMRYRYLNYCSIEDYQKKIERGWRRFGRIHFVPECKSCTKCISMRIDVNNFEFSKSQKRVLNKNKDTKIYIRPPSVTKDHMDLYHKYHDFMKYKKDWNYTQIEYEDYIKSYVDGNTEYATEFLYLRDDKLIGVALVDVLANSISSIYCFYDHDFEEFSIGKFSILTQIRIAKELNIPYIYLGYWIDNHYSMGYKKEYMPFEILKNRATLDEEPIWEKYIQ